MNDLQGAVYGTEECVLTMALWEKVTAWKLNEFARKVEFGAPFREWIGERAYVASHVGFYLAAVSQVVSSVNWTSSSWAWRSSFWGALGTSGRARLKG